MKSRWTRRDCSAFRATRGSGAKIVSATGAVAGRRLFVEEPADGQDGAENKNQPARDRDGVDGNVHARNIFGDGGDEVQAKEVLNSWASGEDEKEIGRLNRSVGGGRDEFFCENAGRNLWSDHQIGGNVRVGGKWNVATMEMDHLVVGDGKTHRTVGKRKAD